MTAGDALGTLTGDWEGTNRLRLMPNDDYRASPSRATVAVAAQGHAVTIAYIWEEDGAPQEGLLVIGNGEAPVGAVAVWVDSWHQNPQWMECRGAVDASGVVRLEGSYAPEAGWRIAVDPSDGTLRIDMDNVMPDGAYRVVEARYARPS